MDRAGCGIPAPEPVEPRRTGAALRRAIELDPGNGFAHRNLGAVLLASKRPADAVAHFRQAVHQLPNDPGALYGLTQALHEGGDAGHEKERGDLLRGIIERFPDHPVAEMARADQTRLAHDVLRSRTPGLRMDVVTYIVDALQRFSTMSKQDVGQMTLEIATLGQSGMLSHHQSR